MAPNLVVMAMISLVILWCMMACPIHVHGQEPPSTTTFSFYDYLQGEWDIQRATASFKTAEQSVEELKGRLTLNRENGTLNLVGRSYDNDTTTFEISNHFSIYVHFDNSNTGHFKFMPSSPSHFGVEGAEFMEVDEEEDDNTIKNNDEHDSKTSTTNQMKTLFSFAFESQMNGMVISHGIWNGGGWKIGLGSGGSDEVENGEGQGRTDSGAIGGHTKGDESECDYQIVISSWDKFMITLFPRTTSPSSSQREVILYIGKKVPVIAEKTFFQKYSTFILLGGFLIFNMFIQKKTRQMQSQQFQPRRSASDSSSSGSSAGSASGPTIEEVNDNTTSTSTTSTTKSRSSKKKE